MLQALLIGFLLPLLFFIFIVLIILIGLVRLLLLIFVILLTVAAAALARILRIWLGLEFSIFLLLIRFSFLQSAFSFTVVAVAVLLVRLDFVVCLENNI